MTISPGDKKKAAPWKPKGKCSQLTFSLWGTEIKHVESRERRPHHLLILKLPPIYMHGQQFVLSCFIPSAPAAPHVRGLEQAAPTAGVGPGSTDRGAHTVQQRVTHHPVTAGISQPHLTNQDRRRARKGKLINFKRPSKNAEMNLTRCMLTGFSLRGQSASPADKNEQQRN